MNYTVEQVMQGIINFADSEVMGKLPTSGKWVVGTGIILAQDKAHHVLDELKENTLVHMLGIVDENGLVDVDALISAMKTTADKYGKLTVDIPLVGRMCFSSTDVDNLRAYIV